MGSRPAGALPKQRECGPVWTGRGPAPGRKLTHVPTRKTTRKKTTSARSKSKTKRKGKPKPKRPAVTVTVGDAVRLPADTSNQIARYDPRYGGAARGTEAIEGIVCSIRHIASGKLAPATQGDLQGYVLEVLHSRTFTPQYSSHKNTGGPRGPERITDGPSWKRIRALLREMASKRQFVSAAPGGLSGEPFASLLDGWRVIKLRAELIELAE